MTTLLTPETIGGTNVIELNNVTKFYGNFRALDHVSFKVAEGEILGLLGPNGAGKTTAMRILTGFLPATSGTASVGGFDVFHDSLDVRRRIGYLPETPPLYPEMTVASYLDFTATLREVPGRKKRQQIAAVAERTNLGDHLHRIIGTLSKGYRQRVGLAQAMIHDPEVLILDEPTVGLDPNQIIEIRNLIKELAHEHTVILSTHILSEVSMTCSRVVIISEGQIVAQDSVDNLQQGESRLCYDVALHANRENWRETLECIPGVVIEQVSQVDGLHKFRLSLDCIDTYDRMFARVAAAGHVFRRISPIGSSLEEVFMRLTSRKQEQEQEREQEQGQDQKQEEEQELGRGQEPKRERERDREREQDQGQVAGHFQSECQNEAPDGVPMSVSGQEPGTDAGQKPENGKQQANADGGFLS